MPARRRGGGAASGGGNARIAFLIRQAGETDKGLLVSAPGITETGHLQGRTKEDDTPAIGGHVDLPLNPGPGVDRVGHLRLQFPADIADYEGAASNNIVVRLFRSDGVTSSPSATWNTGTGIFFILLGPSTTAAQVRTAIDAFATFTVANSITGAGVGSDNLVLAAANNGYIDRNLQGGADLEPAGIELEARPEDAVDGPNILVKYDAGDQDLQGLLAELEENDQGVSIVVPYGTDLTASPEATPFTRGYHAGGDYESPTTGTGGLTRQQVDGRIRTLSKGAALAGGPVWPSSEIADSIARDAEIKPYARVGGGDVDEADIPDSIARDAEVPGLVSDALTLRGPGAGRTDEVPFLTRGGAWSKATTETFRELFASHVGTWPVANGFIFRVGDLTDHDGRVYFVNTQHTANPTDGPETNAHYTPLDNWVGTITQNWYRAGSLGVYNGGLYGAIADVVNTDALPGVDHAKWLLLSHDSRAILDGGAYRAVSTYKANRIVRKSDAAYLTLRDVPAGIDPGVANNWTTYYFRLGWVNGDPSSIVDVDFDADNGEIVSRTRGGTENRKAVPTGGTAVVANPDGTGGDPLNNITIDGTRYQIPQGYLFYSRPTLAKPADISTDTTVPATGFELTFLDAESIPGRVYLDADFVTEWIGTADFVLTWAAGDSNDRQIAVIYLETTHAFNGKTLVHRTLRRLSVQKDRIAVFDYSRFNSFVRLETGEYGPDAEGNTVTIEEADLLGPTTITYKVGGWLERNGSAIESTLKSAMFQGVQTRSYQLAHGAGATFVPPAPRPSITSFARTQGNLSPVAGPIAGERYGFSWQIAQTEHVGSVRLLGFKGAYGDGTGATVLLNIEHGASSEGHPNVGWSNGVGQPIIPQGVSLADGETYTIRLQVFGEGVTNPALTASPAAYQDIVITAHAAATANYHWGRLPYTSGRTAAQYAGDIVFANTDLVTGAALDTTNGYMATPDATGTWVFYLAAKDGETQPASWVDHNGLPASSAFEAVVDQSIGGVDYKVYVMSIQRTNADGSQTYIPRA